MNDCVYILSGGWDYEGYSVIGVFTTKDKALDAKEVINKKPYNGGYDRLLIKRFELDTISND